MKFEDDGINTLTSQVVYRNSLSPSQSPYRLLDPHGQEIDWANDFLDLQHVRGLSSYTLRTYAFSLLHFVRWWINPIPQPLSELKESNLYEYVCHQLRTEPKPRPATINHRLTVLRGLYRFHFQTDIPKGGRDLSHTYITRSPLGYGRPRRATGTFRVKQTAPVTLPLSAAEVAQFWRSFRSFRDLSIVALMLLDGLRSHEVITLKLEDLCLPHTQIRVHGKGNRERVLPLPADTIQALQNYLRVERPLTNSPYLFVCLKGRHRGRPMNSAGLRSLFRHHRKQSQVPQANPHRFRHTFGSDMVRGGVSLPALMHLMGHSHIHTTMLYVQVSPQDVWREYRRAIQSRIPLSPPITNKRTSL
jgi:site-specific recombinase XerD